MKLSNWRQLKVRTDLVISTQIQQGQTVHVVKDPITLRYFRLRPAEYAIMKMLDGKTPVDEVKKRLALLGHDIDDENLQVFLQQLGAANFFENVLPNQSESLYRMALLRRKQKSLWTQIKRILFIKIPLYDPDRLFDRIMPWIRFLWSKWTVMGYGVLFVLALSVVIANFGEVRHNVSFTWLLAPKNLAIFWVIFIFIKGLHERGHGFTCKYFGGEVHELGILVLILTPCLYCNITDAWIQKKHSRKFYMSSAGIVTELIIASLAALVWWITDTGAIHAFAHRVMLLAGVTSILFNGNPLMKFDGYYILSDLLGMPNLRSSSLFYIRQFFRKYILGIDVPGASIFIRENTIKLFYGLASQTWIFYVMFRIVRGMLKRFPPLGVWVLITTLYGLILLPVARIARFAARRRGKTSDVNTNRIVVLSAVAACAAYFLFLYDVGYSISSHCVVEPSQKQVLYATTEGILVWTPFKQGDLVTEGRVVARMENRRLRLGLEESLLRKKAYDAQAAQADSQRDFILRDNYARTAHEIQVTIDQTRRRIEDLTITAPFTGIITTPSSHSRLGTFIPKGHRVIEIAAVSKAKVTVAVAEKDLRFVAEGAPAHVTLRSYPWRAFSGTVDSISISPFSYLPSAALSSKAGGGVATRRGPAYSEVPVDTTYEVNILLNNDEGLLRIGMAGKAKISYGSRRLYDIIYTRVRQNIRRSFGV